MAADFKKFRFSSGISGARSLNEDIRIQCDTNDPAHKPLLFASTEEAVVYLELMGFTVEESHISCNGLAMATHRTLFAIDWLCDNGFSYAAPVRESCAFYRNLGQGEFLRGLPIPGR